MENKPKRVAVIGFDCALPGLIEKHIAEGHLPTFKKFIADGVIAENCLVPFPTITPPNWASIATGAWPGTHGITDFHAPHQPGTTPFNYNIVQAFSSERCHAEYIWDAADKAGKKCIVLNYPGSWPSKMKNGTMVGGSGLSIGENRDGLMAMIDKCILCSDQLITNGIYPMAIQGFLEPAEGWRNLPIKENDALELKAEINFRDAAEQPAETTWYVLASQSAGDGYDRATLSPNKDFNDAFCTLSEGEWSSRIFAKIKMSDGSEREAFFRCKLVELSDDAENLRFYISAIGGTSGWSNPPEIAAEVQSTEGIIGHAGGIVGYVLEWFDLDTLVEINEFYTQYLADAACSLLNKNEWDLFFMHAHSPDWAYHMILTAMNSALPKDAEKRKAAWDAHLKIYEAQDRMLAQILQSCHEDALVIAVSDHGAVPDGPAFNPYSILVPAGLAVLDEKGRNAADDAKMYDIAAGVKKLDARRSSGPSAKAVAEESRGEGLMEKYKAQAQLPDVHKSKCFPERSVYVYINLKGRDPEGIVEPADYEKVQQQIIDALLSYVDPKTGQRQVALALSKRDARILGLYGDNIGDVVYALYPCFSGQHGNILPAAEWGIGSLKALLSFNGPGIKRGYRLERTCNLIDIVPTICYLLDLPLPAQAEGAVIYQALINPNLYPEEKARLQAEVAAMEISLQRGERKL
jgi:predicted AlkP superfamily phosphohydrolase/phosphomutase